MIERNDLPHHAGSFHGRTLPRAAKAYASALGRWWSAMGGQLAHATSHGPRIATATESTSVALPVRHSSAPGAVLPALTSFPARPVPIVTGRAIFRGSQPPCLARSARKWPTESPAESAIGTVPDWSEVEAGRLGAAQ